MPFFFSENQKPVHCAEARSDRVYSVGDTAHYQVPSTSGTHSAQHWRSNISHEFCTPIYLVRDTITHYSFILQGVQRSMRNWLGLWVWLKTPSFRLTRWLTSTRRTLDSGTYTTRWSQRHWGKSKMAECFAGKTWHRAGDGCCMRAQSTGKLLLAGSKVWYSMIKQDTLLLYYLVVSIYSLCCSF